MRDIPHRRAALRSALSLLGLGAALTLAACSAEAVIPEEDVTSLRVIHLAPGAPEIAVLIDRSDTPLFDDVPYLGGSAYAPLEAGSYVVSIVPAESADPAAAVLELDRLELARGTTYTLVVLGTPDSADAFPLDALLLIDEGVQQEIEGFARARAVHVAPGIGEVAVSMAPEDGVEAEIASELAYGESGPYVDVGTSTRYQVSLDVDADGAPDEQLQLDVPADTSVATVYVAIDAAGDPVLVGQLEEGNTQVSGTVPPQ